MQRAEDYGLLGVRSPAPSAVERRATAAEERAADAMLARTLDGIAKRNAERQQDAERRARRARLAPLGKLERRGGATYDWPSRRAD